MPKSNRAILSWSELQPKLGSSILILGSREISAQRVTQLTVQLLKNTQKKVVWGLLEEECILGLEGSPQFRALEVDTLLTGLLEFDSKQVSVLAYSQNNTSTIIAQGDWSAVIAVNGSWHRAFHYREEYKVLKKKKIPYKLVSAFVDEDEALEYEKKIVSSQKVIKAKIRQEYSENEFFQFVDEAAKQSFDYTWQTGAVLTKDGRFLLAAHNKVVPFETYALLHGASKEKQLTPPQDLNHYDTNHAEVEIIIKAAEQNISLKGCSLLINLMPCPICARMLARTEIKEIIYKEEHSGGYAETILHKAGKVIKKASF